MWVKALGFLLFFGLTNAVPAVWAQDQEAGGECSSALEDREQLVADYFNLLKHLSRLQRPDRIQSEPLLSAEETRAWLASAGSIGAYFALPIAPHLLARTQLDSTIGRFHELLKGFYSQDPELLLARLKVQASQWLDALLAEARAGRAQTERTAKLGAPVQARTFESKAINVVRTLRDPKNGMLYLIGDYANALMELSAFQLRSAQVIDRWFLNSHWNAPLVLPPSRQGVWLGGASGFSAWQPKASAASRIATEVQIVGDAGFVKDRLWALKQDLASSVSSLVELDPSVSPGRQARQILTSGDSKLSSFEVSSDHRWLLVKTIPNVSEANRKARTRLTLHRLNERLQIDESTDAWRRPYQAFHLDAPPLLDEHQSYAFSPANDAVAFIHANRIVLHSIKTQGIDASAREKTLAELPLKERFTAFRYYPEENLTVAVSLPAQRKEAEADPVRFHLWTGFFESEVFRDLRLSRWGIKLELMDSKRINVPVHIENGNALAFFGTFEGLFWRFDLGRLGLDAQTP